LNAGITKATDTYSEYLIFLLSHCSNGYANAPQHCFKGTFCHFINEILTRCHFTVLYFLYVRVSTCFGRTSAHHQEITKFGYIGSIWWGNNSVICLFFSGSVYQCWLRNYITLLRLYVIGMLPLLFLSRHIVF
jgi:hypothetical protein